MLNIYSDTLEGIFTTGLQHCVTAGTGVYIEVCRWFVIRQGKASEWSLTLT